MNVGRQLINEHRAGEFKLPENVVIVAAGNRVSDRAGAKQHALAPQRLSAVPRCRG